MDAHAYLLKHSQELSEEYPGKYLAIVDDIVVAVSNSRHDAFEKAKKLCPGEEIYITYMPTDEETVIALMKRRRLLSLYDRNTKINIKN